MPENAQGPLTGRQSAGLSLFHRMALLVTIPLVLLGVAAAINAQLEYEHEQSLAIEHASALARQAAARLDEHYEDVDQFLAAVGEVARSALLRGEDGDPALARLIQTMPRHVTGISILSLDGRMIASTTAAPEQRATLNLADRAYFKDAIASGRLVVGEPVHSRTTNLWVSIAGRPVYDDHGGPAGVVSSSARLDRIQTMLVPTGLPQGTLITVFNNKGVGVASTAEPVAVIGRDLSKVETVRRALIEKRFSEKTLASDGQQRFVAYASGQKLPWIVEVGLPVEPILAPATGKFYRRLMLIAGALLLGLAAAAWLAHRIGQPIRQLALDVDEFGKGAPGRRTQVTGYGEVHRLSVAYNNMMQAVQSKQRELLASEDRFRSLVLLSSDWYWNQDTEYRFTSHSHGRFGEIGLASEDFRGKTRWEMPGATPLGTTWDAHRALLEARQPWRDLIVRYIDRDGSEQYISSSGEPVYDEHGAFAGYRGVARLMTERFQLEARRAAAEAALRESESKFRALTELSSDWYWEQDEHFRFTRVGFDDPEWEPLAGKTFWDVNAEPRDQSWADFKALLARRETFRRVVFRRTSPRGSVAYLSVSGEPVFDDAGAFRGYRGTTVSVTERFRLEQALRESEAKFRALTVLSSDWYWEQDAAFRFTSVGTDDPNWAQPMIGKTRWELNGEPLVGGWADHRTLLERHETFRDVEFRYTGAHGVTAYLSVSGAPVYDANGGFTGYRGTASDISERVRLEQELQERVELLRVTLDTAPVAIGVVRTRDNVSLLANRAAHELLRIDPARREWSVLEYWENRDEARELKRRMEHDGHVRDMEMRVRIQGRENVWGLISAQPARYLGEEVTVATLNDITQRKLLEAQSKALETQREALLANLRGANERLRLLSQQLLDAQESERRKIAHELHDEIGQNLTALKLLAGHLRSQAHDAIQPQVDEWIGLLNQSIEQVRDLSRLLRPTQLDLMGLAPALRAMLFAQARAAGWTVEFAAGDDIGRLDTRVETVAYRVAQEALSNVARHADAASVTLRVHAQRDEKAGKLILHITDDGRGYDMRAVRKRVQEGLSMGLLGMEERVRLVGGTMHVESAPTLGTRIAVTLPFAVEDMKVTA